MASGATAAAGLVTAILSGLIIGALSGAPYQISGPTGAMSAVLIVIAQRVGIEGVWMTGRDRRLIILVIGLLRMGRFVAFIPSSVITGFTSGIAFIIFVGQIDNFLGVQTAGRRVSRVQVAWLCSHCSGAGMDHGAGRAGRDCDHALMASAGLVAMHLGH